MKNPPRAVLFCGILFADETYSKRALDSLISMFGTLRYESEPQSWHSDHYSDELGSPVMRQFVFFRNLVPQDALKGAKIAARAIERELSVDGRRSVNLDPGIVAPARVVLATTKDYSHRIYLGEGIFAEATLTFRRSGFVPSGFAYSDYTDEAVLSMFQGIRKELIGEIAEG